VPTTNNPFKKRQDFIDGMKHLFLYAEMCVAGPLRSAGPELVALEDAAGAVGQSRVCSTASK